MGQRTRILTEIWGFDGWKVKGAYFEWADGTRADVAPPMGMQMNARLVLVVERCWGARCGECFGACRGKHETLRTRRWHDLSWGTHQVDVEATPIRVKCKRCGSCPVELLAWADTYQRETRRLQHYLALQSASMPTSHVAVLHGLTWGTVRRAEAAALARWLATRTPVALRHVGIDEKYLGRRHKRDEKWVTIISNNETGEPLWIEFGRGREGVERWLRTLAKEDKAKIELFVMDMHDPFKAAVRGDPDLAHAKVVHDAFHIIKRANEAITEIRKDIFFRAGPTMRGIGRGKHWLVLRNWDNTSDQQRDSLREILRGNKQLARSYWIVDELRAVLHAPDRASIEAGLYRILMRTQRRDNKHLRKLHDSLREHWNEIVALGEHRPATGRVEALNNNWESLVRRSRGHRDLDWLLLKLRFMTANPIRNERGVQRFLALGLQPPMRAAA